MFNTTWIFFNSSTLLKLGFDFLKHENKTNDTIMTCFGPLNVLYRFNKRHVAYPVTCMEAEVYVDASEIAIDDSAGCQGRLITVIFLRYGRRVYCT